MIISPNIMRTNWRIIGWNDSYAFTTSNWIINVSKEINVNIILYAITKAQSCKEVKIANPSAVSGLYEIKPDINGLLVTVYCDMDADGGGWTRLYWKDGAETVFNDNFVWTKVMIEGLEFTNFAVSDSTTTIMRESSWILQNVSMSSERTTAATELLDSLQSLTNLANKKTPTDTKWSQTYGSDRDWRLGEGYFFVIEGILSTFGSWTSARHGCTGANVPVGGLYMLRIGGSLGHSGEFVQTGCSNYPIEVSSISSRWNTNNTRVIWVK